MRCVVAPGCGSFSRKQIDEFVAVAKHLGGKGLAHTKVEGGKLEGGVAKFLSDAEQKAIIKTSGAKDGDLIFYASDSNSVVYKVMVCAERWASSLGFAMMSSLRLRGLQISRFLSMTKKMVAG